MYAINHAATALLLRKKESPLPLLPLLVSTQLVEILWVLFNFLGFEYFTVSGGKIHLDFLPYSHSVFSSITLATISYILIRWVFKNKELALPFAFGVVSHVFLDVIFHEKDIRLSPFSETPTWGLGVISLPALNFGIELLYGIFCWWAFRGNIKLLLVIVLFNILNLPVMLASGTALNVFVSHPSLLPTFILLQIIVTWYVIFKFSKEDEHLQKN